MGTRVGNSLSRSTVEGWGAWEASQHSIRLSVALFIPTAFVCELIPLFVFVFFSLLLFPTKAAQINQNYVRDLEKKELELLLIMSGNMFPFVWY